MELGRVLVIEDDPDVASVLELTLLRMGAAEVAVAPDGTEGLERARSDRWDLMLVDLLLPGKDGFDLVLEFQRWRQDLGATAPSPTIVFVTSAARTVGDELISRSGAHGLICKPFTMAGLAQRLEDIVAARGPGG
jgi:two-component system OmpR family response regulator